MSAPRLTAKHLATRFLRPLVRRAARAYVAGERLADALQTSRRLRERGLTSTLGYWDCQADLPADVAKEYRMGVVTLAGTNNYLSIKLAALGFVPSLVAEVAWAAVAHGVRLHCDSLDISDCNPSQKLVDEILAQGAKVSYTLPGRWKRSLDDANWVCRRNLAVRVVKGQWADPFDPCRDLRAGFLEVVDQLAGRAREVAVATHDVPIAAEAIRRLREAGTPCSLELLYGLPMRAALRLAARAKVPVRIYVPYGTSYLPYALSNVRANPRMAWWLLRDLVGVN